MDHIIMSNAHRFYFQIVFELVTLVSFGNLSSNEKLVFTSNKMPHREPNPT
jgi:hypothetical protein